MQRIVIHVDMDYFYAALEERENPELKDKPVVVCVYSARGEGRGAVSTANYRARELGIKSGMSCPRAKKIAPDAVFLPVNFELYERVSENIMSYLRTQADAFEQVSIDEAFLEVTHHVRGDYARAEKLGEKIKEDIYANEGLTCSVGIAPNKLLAKIASGYRKPNGMTVVEPSKVREFLSPRKTAEIGGVGRKTATALEEMGITTIGELAKMKPLVLVEKFGKAKGAWLYNASHGRDDSRVQERETEQISRITTLPKNTGASEEVIGVLHEIVEELHQALRERKLSFRTVSFIAVTTGLKTHTRSRTLPSATDDKELLLSLARELMEAYLVESELSLRRVGVKVSALGRAEGQKSLLDYGR